MPNVPMPISAQKGDWDGLKAQIYELIRDLYEEKIAGLKPGMDIYTIDSDEFTLVTKDNDGWSKTGGRLSLAATLNNLHINEWSQTIILQVGHYIPCPPVCPPQWVPTPDSENVEMKNNTFFPNTKGVELGTLNPTTFTANTVQNNSSYAGRFGIYTYGSYNNTYTLYLYYGIIADE
jgi:hypothetical protein